MQRCAVLLASFFLRPGDTQHYNHNDNTVDVKMPPMGFTDRYGHPLPPPPVYHVEGQHAAAWTQPVPVVTPPPLPDGLRANSQLATNIPKWSGMMVQPKNPNDWIPERCLVPPLIPQTWFAERPFFGWWGLNTVNLKDRHNNHWGTVVSKWGLDWTNPFGIPGFDFWLKRQGSNARGWKEFFDIWGTDYLFLASSNTNMLATESTIYDCKGKPIIWAEGNQIFDTDAGIVGGPVGPPPQRDGRKLEEKTEVPEERKPEETEEDKNEGFWSSMGRRLYGAKVKAGFYLSAGNFERNMMIIYDLAMPPNELVRLQQTEPCNPFPPFCSTMPAWSPFLTDHWSGSVVQKDFGEDMGKFGHIRVTANGATDIRFLSLYGTHVFSPTRFAPCIYWIVYSIFFACCFGCFYRCCCGCCQYRDVETKVPIFEGEVALHHDQIEASKTNFGVRLDTTMQTPWGSMFTRPRPAE